MRFKIFRVLMTLLAILVMERSALSSTHPIAAVTISGIGAISASGNITITLTHLNSQGQYVSSSETIQYGALTTANSLASSFAAAFSSDPSTAFPALCTQDICAKSHGSVITFELRDSTMSFVQVASSSTGGSSFNVTATNWPLVLTGTPNPSSLGSAVNFIAIVSSGATGLVEFVLDGNTTLGQASLLPNSNTAILSTSGIPGGVHSVTAFYKGDGIFSPSTSPPLSQLVIESVVSNISSTSLAAVSIGGEVIITGSGFGTSSGTVTVDDVNASISFWAPTIIIIHIPSGVSVNSMIQVFVGAGTSNQFQISIPDGIN